MRLFFANGIYFKVASQVNVKLELSLRSGLVVLDIEEKKMSDVLFLCGSDK